MTTRHRFVDEKGILLLKDGEKKLFETKATLQQLRKAQGDLIITSERIIFKGKAEEESISAEFSDSFLKKVIFGENNPYDQEYIRFALEKHQLSGAACSESLDNGTTSNTLSLNVYDTSQKEIQVRIKTIEIQLDGALVTDAIGKIESLFEFDDLW